MVVAPVSRIASLIVMATGRWDVPSLTVVELCGASQTMSDQLQRVQIVNRQHPHFEEYGRFTGKIIQMKFGAQAKMAEVKLEHCRHGGDACFVNPGDVRQVAER